MRLPDFLIIGTAKAGTAAATINLSLHPDVAVCPRNGDKAALELHFFCDEATWARGLEWYAAHFAVDACMVGGKSTDYLGKHVAHRRMRDVVPDVRLIVMLREPAARAYSHWNHFNQKYGDRDPKYWHVAPFEDVVGLTPGVEPPWYHQELVDFGHYAEHLEHLWRFFSREQTHVMVMERVRADMPAEYSRVFAFLGVEAPVVDHARFVEDNARPYTHGPMRADTRARLRARYADHNERLFEMLGERIPEWGT